MSIVRVVLDYGHGGEKPGASYGGVQEKAVNLQLGSKIYSSLHDQAGADKLKVILTRDTDEGIPLSIRYRLINQYHVTRAINVVVSIHFNAAPSVPSAHGFEVYYMQGSIKGNAAAKSIVESVNDDGFDIRGRGYKTTAELGRQLAMIHKTAPPSVLIEAGFLSNDADRASAINIEWQDKMAKAVAKGIWNFIRTS